MASAVSGAWRWYEYPGIIKYSFRQMTAKNKKILFYDVMTIFAKAFLYKPIDLAELAARVNANLRQYDRVMQKLPEEKDKHPEEIRTHDLRILVNSWKVYKGD